jgi:4-carboxymuconolactone decarboxylase
MLTNDDIRSVSPALERYTKNALFDDVWKRPDLSPRDRSIVTLATLISRNQTVEMPFHLRLALDSGVRPAEISEIITHLAFYSGWANGMAAGRELRGQAPDSYDPKRCPDRSRRTTYAVNRSTARGDRS